MFSKSQKQKIDAVSYTFKIGAVLFKLATMMSFGGLVGWLTSLSFGLGPALAVGVFGAAAILWLLERFRKFLTNNRVVGGLDFEKIKYESKGKEVDVLLVIRNITANDLFVRIDEIQKTSRCDGKGFKTILDNWSDALRVNAGQTMSVTIDSVGQMLTNNPKASRSELGHSHYRVKASMGKNSDGLRCGMLCHIAGNPPIHFQPKKDAPHVEFGGGGSFLGITYSSKDIRGWPKGYDFERISH